MVLKIHMNPTEKLMDAQILVLLHEIHIKHALGIELVSIKMNDYGLFNFLIV